VGQRLRGFVVLQVKRVSGVGLAMRLGIQSLDDVCVAVESVAAGWEWVVVLHCGGCMGGLVAAHGRFTSAAGCRVVVCRGRFAFAIDRCCIWLW